MPRPPYDVARAKRLLSEWIVQRIPKAPADAPITIAAGVAYLTAHGLPTHKATLIKYKLNTVIADGAREQQEAGGGRRVDAERAAYDAQLRELRAKLEAVEKRNHSLLAEIATMRFNAREARLPEGALMKPIPSARRHRQSSTPHAGAVGGTGRANRSARKRNPSRPRA